MIKVRYKTKYIKLVNSFKEVQNQKRSFWEFILTLLNYVIYKIDFLKFPYALNKPLFLQIEPTSRCNLRCPMCMRDKFNMPIGDMSFQGFQRIISQTKNLYRIHLQGNGEPFLHPKLIDFIRYARDKGIMVTVITNGTLINEDLAKSIVLSGLNEIQVSIDSLNKKEFETIRTGASLDKVTKNVKNMVTTKERLNSDIVISITVVIQKKNVHEIPKFIRFTSQIGAQKVGFQYLEPKHKKKYRLGYFDQNSPFHDTSKLVKAIHEAKRLAKKENIICDVVSQRTKTCLWPWEGLYVTWDGNVTPCCLIFDYFIGNVFETDLYDIWNNKKIKNFRKQLRGINIPRECIGCSLYNDR